MQPAAAQEEEEKPDEQVPDMTVVQLAFKIAQNRGTESEVAAVLQIVKDKVLSLALHALATVL